MGIIVNLDVMMAKRKIGVTELAKEIDLTMANLSILKNNKAKAVRFTTLDALCKALRCQPGDILEYVEDDDEISDWKTYEMERRMTMEQQNKTTQQNITTSETVPAPETISAGQNSAGRKYEAVPEQLPQTKNLNPWT